jgi:cellulose biosynthesis protein BcsQ
MEMKLISVYSTSANVGKRTVATTLANQAAKNGYSTLLIELDYINPSISLTLGITHSEKNALNYFELAVNKNSFNLDKFIMKNSEIKATQKDLSKVHQTYAKNLDYLIFPSDYDNSMFPRLHLASNESLTERAQYIVEQLINDIYTVNYDVVVLSLPNDKEDIFSMPITLESHHIINIIGPSLKRFEETKKLRLLLEKFNQDKWIHVLNMASNRFVDSSDYELALNPIVLKHIIPFDEMRLKNDLNAEIGSQIINESINEILIDCKLEIETNKKVKGLKFLMRG